MSAVSAKIPYLNLKAQFESIRQDVIQAIMRVVESQELILGDEVASFEKEAAEYLKCMNAVSCASGTDALLLSLKALGIGPGDEVLVPTFTFFATAGAVHNVGATPVFVDIEPQGYNIAPEAIEKKITARTKAIIPVHLFGQAADMDAILEIARQYGLKVIEDVAQAIGSKYRGRTTGTLGDTGAFSFYPTKNLGGFGDGGLILTQDDEVALRLRLLRVHGDLGGYRHAIVGFNSRLDAIQAAVLRVKLRHLEQWTEQRRQRAETYQRILSNCDITLPVELPQRHHAYNLYVIRSPRRDALMNYLRANGVGCSVYYPKPLHLQECFKHLGYREGDFPVAEQASREVLALPIYPELTEDQQNRIGSLIASLND